MEDSNGDLNFNESNTTQDSLTELNRNNNASSTSVNMTFVSVKHFLINILEF